MMLDTVCITGYGQHYRTKPYLEKYTVYKYMKYGDEKVVMAQMENTPSHQSAYNPSYDLCRVQCNPHKLLFEHNVYNYETRPANLAGIINSVGNYFFPRGDFFVNRVDLGGVHTFEDAAFADRTLEEYRGTRPVGSITRKYKNQPYQTAVFIPGRNQTLKIYNKGAEMAHKLGVYEVEQFPHFDLRSTLRFEKGYKSGGFQNLGMTKDKGLGIHIDSFNMDTVYQDFIQTFSSWEVLKKEHITDKKGVIGLLAVLDNLGRLSDVEAAGIVSRSSTWRYRKLKQDAACDFVLKFAPNVPEKLANKWAIVRSQLIYPNYSGLFRFFVHSLN